MEKSEAIRRFNEGKHYIETCLEQIASLEQNNDKELRQVLRGTVMVEVSYKALENFCKVVSYVIDGKDGAQRLKGELLGLKEIIAELYKVADRQNLITIKEISKTIISEIKEVGKWTGDNDYPEIPKELLDLFPTKKQCQDFVQRNYEKSAPIVAYAYLREKGVVDPHDSKNDIPVIAILYKYFVKPFDEREGARTNFYNFFKQK